jgi:hypothetical protein
MVVFTRDLTQRAGRWQASAATRANLLGCETVSVPGLAETVPRPRQVRKRLRHRGIPA